MIKISAILTLEINFKLKSKVAHETYDSDLNDIVLVVLEIAEDDQRRPLHVLLLMPGEIVPKMALSGRQFAQMTAQRLDRESRLGPVPVENQSQASAGGSQSVARQIGPTRSGGGGNG
jgi:hypothetical protein